MTAPGALRRVAVAGGEMTCRHDVPPECGTGSDEAPPLLLLHGFTGSHASWETLISRLRERGRISTQRILSVDLPGHGATRLAARCSTMEGAARALEGLLDASGARRSVVAGYSMGGRLALYLALTRPARVAGLLLESASPGVEDARERAARRARDARLALDLENDGIEVFVDRWESLPLFATQVRSSPTLRARQRRIRLAQDPAGLEISLRAMGTGVQPWLGGRLGELTMPLTFAAGGLDAKFAAIARRMHRAAPGSRLQIVDDAGHALHLEAPERMAALLEALCRRCPAGTAAAPGERPTEGRAT